MEEGRAAGLKEGQNRVLELMEAMTANGDSHLIARLKGDRALLEQMYEKYQI